MSGGGNYGIICEQMDKHYLSANQYQSDMWRLASVIRKSGWKPDFLVGLWRGGAPVAIAVHEYFRATGWNVQHIPLKCWSYTGIGANSNKVDFLLGDAIFGMFRAGDKVLFVDDVFDTGKTAAAVMDQMRGIGAEARIACGSLRRTRRTSSRTSSQRTSAASGLSFRMRSRG